MRLRRASLVSPANSTGCGSTGASGAAGRSRHTASIGIGLDRHEAAAGARGGAREAVVAVDRLQPRIEAELAALGEVGGDPGVGRLLGNLVRHEGLGIDLAAHGQGVAAVDEDRGLVGQHDRQARRAAEAGEPAQPLRAARHVLALVLVGARHDEAVEAALLQFGAQGGQARRRGGRVLEPVIGLGEFGAPFGQRLGQTRHQRRARSARSIRGRPALRGRRPPRASGNRGRPGPGRGRAGAEAGGRRRGRNSWGINGPYLPASGEAI